MTMTKAKPAAKTAAAPAAGTWRIKMVTPNGEAYNGNYTPGDARKAVAKIQTMINQIIAGKFQGDFSLTWTALPCRPP